MFISLGKSLFWGKFDAIAIKIYLFVCTFKKL